MGGGQSPAPVTQEEQSDSACDTQAGSGTAREGAQILILSPGPPLAPECQEGGRNQHIGDGGE